MIYVEEAELADRIEDLIEKVDAGEEVYITRSGKIVATLVPCDVSE